MSKFSSGLVVVGTISKWEKKHTYGELSYNVLISARTDGILEWLSCTEWTRGWCYASLSWHIWLFTAGWWLRYVGGPSWPIDKRPCGTSWWYIRGRLFDNQNGWEGYVCLHTRRQQGCQATTQTPSSAEVKTGYRGDLPWSAMAMTMYSCHPHAPWPAPLFSGDPTELVSPSLESQRRLYYGSTPSSGPGKPWRRPHRQKLTDHGVDMLTHSSRLLSRHRWHDAMQWETPVPSIEHPSLALTTPHSCD